MNSQTYTLEFITPCFCAGADQARAEIRAPAIRGQLRWWFRAFGGTRADEQEVFGGIAGEEGRSSTLVVRVAELARGLPWRPPKVEPNAPEAYVWHYASVSGKQKGQPGPGPRWSEHGNLPPGTKVHLQLLWRRQPPPGARQGFDDALKAFLALGAVGMRVTRGVGAFCCLESPLTSQALAEVESLLKKHRFGFLVYRQGLSSWEEAIRAAGQTLKEDLRPRFPAGKLGDQPGPLGSSKPRQTSGLYLRPVCITDNNTANNKYALCVFEAPAERVLGRESRRGAPALRVLRRR